MSARIILPPKLPEHVTAVFGAEGACAWCSWCGDRAEGEHEWVRHWLAWHPEHIGEAPAGRVVLR